MAALLGSRLEAARRRFFVGRRAELDTFADLLRQDEPACAVLFVSGAGGVGKTTLLHRFAGLATAAGWRPLQLDARLLPVERGALAQALAPALGGQGRTVVLVDTYELLEALDGYLRDDLLPRLPADSLVVLAGRRPPASPWLTDLGWSGLLRHLPLGNLSPAESTEYLTLRGVPAHLHADAVRFTHGHPLALALLGEVPQPQGAALDPGGNPDVLAVLLDRLLDHVPSRRHGEALEAMAQVRVLGEPLLAALLPDADARDLFGWLRGLPVVDSGPAGLFLHDLARDVLAADLRWRDPARYGDLHDRARSFYLERLAAAPAGESPVLLDLMYLHDDLRPILRPPDPDSAAPLRVESPTPGDADEVTAIVARHEGAASGRLAAHWLRRQPAAWLVVRERSGAVAGVVCLLAASEATDADAALDPAIASCLRQLAALPALRPGERATLVRFWLARDGYQAVSPVQSLITSELGRHFLTAPDLAVSLVPFADPAPWADFCAYADHVRMPEADFTVGGVRYAVHGHDWRAVPPAAWVALLSQRETSAAPLAVPAPRGLQPVLVLSEAEFAQAVRAALRDVTRPDRLRSSPLLRARLVTCRVAPDARPPERVAALQAAIRDAAATLQRSGADTRGYRALHRAYLAPAATLERAAEALGLPSSTFRRHLGQGLSRLTALLWQSELGTWEPQ